MITGGAVLSWVITYKTMAPKSQGSKPIYYEMHRLTIQRRDDRSVGEIRTD